MNKKLPPDVIDHKEFTPPQEFDSVNWRDVADIRERIKSLETFRNIAISVVGVIFSVWILLFVTAIWGKLFP